MHIQLLHTSASLTINENWDPDVRDDMEMMLNRWESQNGKCGKSLCCWEERKLGPTERPVNHRPVFSPFFPFQISFVQQRQRQAPLFGILALIFLCKRGRGKVMQCMELVFSPVCVPAAALYFTDGRLPSLPGCCCCANNCANFILRNICTKTPSQARARADSLQALL